jgi:hypothetical protein
MKRKVFTLIYFLSSSLIQVGTLFLFAASNQKINYFQLDNLFSIILCALLFSSNIFLAINGRQGASFRLLKGNLALNSLLLAGSAIYFLLSTKDDLIWVSILMTVTLISCLVTLFEIQTTERQV